MVASLPSTHPQAQPRVESSNATQLSQWRLARQTSRGRVEKPLEIVHSIKEARATDPILKFRPDTRRIRDIYGKDTSHLKMERKIKGEDMLMERGDPRSYMMGPEEMEEPPRKIWTKKRPEQDGAYKNPFGKIGSKDPVPPPRANYPFVGLQEVVWSERAGLPHNYPDLSPDEVTEIMKRDEHFPAGIDLSEVETSVRHKTINVIRSGQSSTFQGMLEEEVSISATVTNDFYECERWAERVIHKLPQNLGVELFNGFVYEPIPLPGLMQAPNSNRIKLPPVKPLPPTGSLPLHKEDDNIFALCLSTDEEALLVQLHLMDVIGPKLRALLEHPLIDKACHQLPQNRYLLRQDGVDIYAVEDVTKMFSDIFQHSEVRNRVTEVCKRAGHLNWLKSITGVTIKEPRDLYPYMWGENDISDEMLEIAVRRAYANLVVQKVISAIDPSDLVGLKRPPREKDEEKPANDLQSSQDNPPALVQSNLQPYTLSGEPAFSLPVVDPSSVNHVDENLVT